MYISNLIEGLQQANLELTAEEVAEILWLWVKTLPEEESELLETNQEITQSPDLNTKIPGNQETSPSTTVIVESPQQKSVDLYPKVIDKYLVPETKNQEQRYPLQVPDAPAISNQRQLGRALKSLRRNFKSATEQELDEGKTVNLFVEQKLWIPILQPTLTRHWLDLVLVVEINNSLVIWQQTISELREFLKSLGIFRSFESWGLQINLPKSSLSLEWLFLNIPNITHKFLAYLILSYQKEGISIFRYDDPQMRPYPPEAIGGTGRETLILLLSDLVSPVWYRPEIYTLLQQWSRKGMVNLLHFLPERLWPRTILGQQHRLKLSSPNRLVANQKLISLFATQDNIAADGIEKLEQKQEFKLPVISLEPDILEAWSKMLMGIGNNQCIGYGIKPPPTPVKNLAKLETTPQQRVQRFQTLASPTALKLAELLSAVLVTLPVIRVIQYTMLPNANQSHVAEVLMGGLFKPLTETITPKINPDEIEFEFFDGVREELLSWLTVPEITSTIEQVSAYLANKMGKRLKEFEAFLIDSRLKNNDLDKQIYPFAQVSAKVLQKLGGAYATFANQLENYQQRVEGNNDDYKYTEEAFPPFQVFQFEVATISISDDTGSTSNKQHRIALISVEGDPGSDNIGAGETAGQDIYVRHVGEALAQQGWQVDMFTRQVSPDQQKIVHHSENCRTIRFPAGPVEFIPRDELFGYLPEFINHFLAFQQENGITYPLIHTNYWLSSWVGMQLKKIQGSKQVHTYHSLGAVKYNTIEAIPAIATKRLAVEKEVLETAETIVATSPQEKQHMRSLVSTKGKIDIIPCGTDIQQFGSVDREAARADFGIDPQAKVVLYVGRFDPRKGIETLVRAVNQSEFRDSNNLQLIIGGGSTPGNSDGEERDRIEGIINELGMSDITILPGRLSQAILPTYYAGADVCVVPSHYESFGLVAIEAMASGTPVVASDVGGLQFTVIPEETGLLVPQDVDAFAIAIDRFLSNPEWRDEVGKAGRKLVETRFSWDIVVSQLSALYAHLLELEQPIRVEPGKSIKMPPLLS